MVTGVIQWLTCSQQYSGYEVVRRAPLETITLPLCMAAHYRPEEQDDKREQGSQLSRKVK